MTPRLPGSLERIAVLRALPGLGDFLCAIPALRALRGAYPDAHVTLVGLPAVAPLAQRFRRYIDELLPFPGFPGIPEATAPPQQIVAFLAEAQSQGFDLAIQLHGSGRTTNAFVALLGARRTAGFTLPGFPVPDPELFMAYPGESPEPLRHLQLMRFLGIPADDPALEFPLDGAEADDTGALLDAHGLAPGTYACINGGASVPQRRWPPERFAAVADALDRRGLSTVLVGAAGEEPIAAAIAREMRTTPVDLTGATPVGTLASLMLRAAVTITNDTGTSHLAAAVGARSVVIFSGSDPRRWAPLDTVRHRPLGTALAPPAGASCDRCLRDGRLKFGDPVLREVTPAEVIAECEALLEGSAWIHR